MQHAYIKFSIFELFLYSQSKLKLKTNLRWSVGTARFILYVICFGFISGIINCWHLHWRMIMSMTDKNASASNFMVLCVFIVEQK